MCTGPGGVYHRTSIGVTGTGGLSVKFSAVLRVFLTLEVLNAGKIPLKHTDPVISLLKSGRYWHCGDKGGVCHTPSLGG